MARVLVVDDEPEVLNLVRVILEFDHHVVTEATDGTQALALLGQGAYDLLILDLMMPDLDGREVLRRLDGAVATIVLSAALTRGSEQECRDLGAQACIAKPFNVQHLVDTVTEALRPPTPRGTP